MQFHKFNEALRNHVDAVSKHSRVAFVSKVDKEVLWDTYLDSFPSEMNPIFRERREFDCQCCKSFIRSFGNVVFINPDTYEMTTIWDFQVPHAGYQQVLNAMGELIRSYYIQDQFVDRRSEIGTACTLELMGNTVVHTWDHFNVNIQLHLQHKRHITEDSVRGKTRTAKDTLKSSLDSLKPEVVQDVLDMIDENILYRGAEFRRILEKFSTIQDRYNKVAAWNKDSFLWYHAATESHTVTHIKNTAIGTLLTDLSSDMSLESALARWNSVMAPTNYQQPKTGPTKKQIDEAHKEIIRLGFENSLGRRFAHLSDVSVRDVIYADRNARKHMSGLGGIMETLKSQVAEDPKRFEKAEPYHIDDFIFSILPGATSLELFMENRHQTNLVSLIAPKNAEAPSMLKWGNNFSWVYNGNVASSMRDQVKALGGRVDGALRFTHSWNHPDMGRNGSLMDLHVFIPGSAGHGDGNHDGYPVGPRVGWNRREDPMTEAKQDVDYTPVAPEGYIPIENIAFPRIDKMPEGKYVFKIHNWDLRHPTTSGFRAEIEFAGQIYSYQLNRPMAHKEWITLAEVTLKNGVFKIEHKLPHSEQTTEAWGLNTNQFHKVSLMCFSPNFWNTETGNKHYMFMVPGCINPDTPSGFFNEQLSSDLHEHRKTFSALSKLMKVEHTDDQLSGFGFSSTERNGIIVRINNNRIYKLVF